MSTHPRRRLALALTLGALLTLGAANPAGAEVPRAPGSRTPDYCALIWRRPGRRSARSAARRSAADLAHQERPVIRALLTIASVPDRHMEARAIVAGTGDYGAVGQREFPGSVTDGARPERRRYRRVCERHGAGGIGYRVREHRVPYSVACGRLRHMATVKAMPHRTNHGSQKYACQAIACSSASLAASIAPASTSSPAPVSTPP